MSRRIVIALLERAHTDDQFRMYCTVDPLGALAEYTLRPNERTALLSGDPRLLEAIGLTAAFCQCHSFPFGPPSGRLIPPARESAALSARTAPARSRRTARTTRPPADSRRAGRR